MGVRESRQDLDLAWFLFVLITRNSLFPSRDFLSLKSHRGVLGFFFVLFFNLRNPHVSVVLRELVNGDLWPQGEATPIADFTVLSDLTSFIFFLFFRNCTNLTQAPLSTQVACKRNYFSLREYSKTPWTEEL